MLLSNVTVFLLILHISLAQRVNDEYETSTSPSSGRRSAGRRWTNSKNGHYQRVVSRSYDLAESKEPESGAEESDPSKEKTKNKRLTSRYHDDWSSTTEHASDPKTNRQKEYSNPPRRRRISADTDVEHSTATIKRRRLPTIPTTTTLPQTMSYSLYNYFRPLEQDVPQDDILPFLDFGRKLSPVVPTPSSVNSIENKSTGTRLRIHVTESSVMPTDDVSIHDEMDLSFDRRVVERNSVPSGKINSSPNISNLYRKPTPSTRTSDNVIITSDCVTEPNFANNTKSKKNPNIRDRQSGRKNRSICSPLVVKSLQVDSGNIKQNVNKIKDVEVITDVRERSRSAEVVMEDVKPRIAAEPSNVKAVFKDVKGSDLSSAKLRENKATTAGSLHPKSKEIIQYPHFDNSEKESSKGSEENVSAPPINVTKVVPVNVTRSGSSNRYIKPIKNQLIQVKSLRSNIRPPMGKKSVHGPLSHMRMINVTTTAEPVTKPSLLDYLKSQSINITDKMRVKDVDKIDTVRTTNSTQIPQLENSKILSTAVVTSVSIQESNTSDIVRHNKSTDSDLIKTNLTNKNDKESPIVKTGYLIPPVFKPLDDEVINKTKLNKENGTEKSISPLPLQFSSESVGDSRNFNTTEDDSTTTTVSLSTDSATTTTSSAVKVTTTETPTTTFIPIINETTTYYPEITTLISTETVPNLQSNSYFKNVTVTNETPTEAIIPYVNFDTTVIPNNSDESFAYDTTLPPITIVSEETTTLPTRTEAPLASATTSADSETAVVKEEKNNKTLVLNNGGVESTQTWTVPHEGDDSDVEVAYQEGIGITTYILVFLGVVPIVLGASVAARFLVLHSRKKVLDESEYSSEYNRSPLSICTSSPLPTKLPRVPTHLGWEMEKSVPNILPTTTARWEFPREKLRLQTLLGQGNFGQVWKAEADDISGHEGLTRLVAVKTVKESANTREREDLLRELGIMQELGSHPNVVTLLGCCTEKEPYFLIMEYVMYGKMLAFLRDHRTRAHYYNFSDVSDALTSRDLTVFAYCVARGMDYLGNKGIIHRDLAARNILVDHNKLCKIADFGMSRNVQDTGQIYEQRQSKGALPIRWMAPESLHFSLFTHKSDVWSFGILMWEIVTLGSTPYATMGAREVMKRVRDGYRLERPNHCRMELFRVISRCWHSDPNKRPTFSELKQEIGQLLGDTDSGGGYVDLESLADEIKQGLHSNSTLQRNH